jgi:hypothetical protein
VIVVVIRNVILTIKIGIFFLFQILRMEYRWVQLMPVGADSISWIKLQGRNMATSINRPNVRFYPEKVNK